MKPMLTLGPLFFHWSEEDRRDFYFRIADEADVDEVYVGEVTCSKREPFFEPYQEEVIERLQKAGKKVNLSALAMVTTPREIASIKEKAKSGFLVEANDVAAVQVLAGKPFIVGPFINVTNEGTRDYLIGLGAERIVFASELSADAIGVLVSQDGSPSPCGPVRRSFSEGGRVENAQRFRGGVKKANPSPAKTKGLLTQDQVFASSPARGEEPCLQTEVQVFGRQPLSVAMRCYAARAEGRQKDGCRAACQLYPDGMPVDDFAGEPILSVNGTMVMSRGYVVLLRDLAKLKKQGVTHFRLSPQKADMVKIADLYRAVLSGKKDPKAAEAQLKKLTGKTPFVNGFLHDRKGMVWED